MELLIVTGMSGAGKSQAANILEDMGYYCVDNIPPAIIPSFVELSRRGAQEMVRLAVVTDIRGGEMFDDIHAVLQSLKKDNVDYKILFLDANNDTLIRRFKENRRKHPLCERDELSLGEAVATERRRLAGIRADADYVFDTSLLSIAQLKSQMTAIFMTKGKKGMSIICRSFGYKYGIDVDADIVVDVRCLRNPFYVSELKEKTGLDAEVRDYVMDSEDSRTFAKKLFDFIDFSLPLYLGEGKSQLVVSFGCTGGKHRSVTFAEMMNRHFNEAGFTSAVMHRDISRK